MGRVITRVLLLVALLVSGFVPGSWPILPTPASAAAATIPDRTAVANGPVQAIARAGDTIFIGGRFDRVGPRTGPGVEVGPDGSINPGLPEVAGAGPSASFGAGGGLSTVAPDGSGGWFIGGLFTHVGGIARTNLAHIRADRSVDPGFTPGVNDAVQAMVVSGSVVYVAGLFTSINGQPRNYIAALKRSDGSLTAFNPGADAGVAALALSGDGAIVYAGGRFKMIGGQPRLALAGLNAADGTATLTFNPSATGNNGSGVVDALAISGSTLYIGGTFNSVGGQPRNNIAAVSLGAPSDGLAVPGFNPSPTYSGCAACASIMAVVVSGSTVYAGGLFDTIGGASRRFLAGLSTVDGTATSFNPSPNGNIFAIAVSGSTVYASGGFNSGDGSPSIGGQARNFAAALNASDGSANGFNPNPNALVSAFGVTGSSVYLAGYFSSLGGSVRRGIAAISAVDGSVTSFNPDARGFNGGTATVYALAPSGSTLYVGGYFGSIGGQPRASIAALNTGDGSASAWNPSASYFGGPAVVEALAIGSQGVYAGGVFNSIGGQPRSNLAAIGAAGTATTWDPNSNGEVNALAVAGPVVYAAGHFDNIGGQARVAIAAVNQADASITSWNPDILAPANVLAIAVSGSAVYVGGDFTQVHGVARRNIAAVSATDGTPTAFDPEANDPNTGGGVFAVAVNGPTVYAAGFFSVIGGQARSLVAGLDAGSGTATGFDPGGAPGFGAFALATASDGTVYVGGSFDTFDRGYQQGFAQFAPNPAPVLPESHPWILMLAAAGAMAAALAQRRRRLRILATR